MNLVEITDWNGVPRAGYLNTDAMNRADLGGAFDGSAVFARDEAVRSWTFTFQDDPPPDPPPGFVFLALPGGAFAVFQVENVVALLDSSRFGDTLTQVVPVSGGPFDVLGDVNDVASDFNAAAGGGGSSSGSSGTYAPNTTASGGGNITVNSPGVGYWFSNADDDGGSITGLSDGYESLALTNLVLTPVGPGPFSETFTYDLPVEASLGGTGSWLTWSDAFNPINAGTFVPPDWAVSNDGQPADSQGQFTVAGVTDPGANIWLTIHAVFVSA